MCRCDSDVLPRIAQLGAYSQRLPQLFCTRRAAMQKEQDDKLKRAEAARKEAEAKRKAELEEKQARHAAALHVMTACVCYYSR